MKSVLEMIVYMQPVTVTVNRFRFVRVSLAFNDTHRFSGRVLITIAPGAAIVVGSLTAPLLHYQFSLKRAELYAQSIEANHVTDTQQPSFVQ